MPDALNKAGLHKESPIMINCVIQYKQESTEDVDLYPMEGG